MAYDTSIPAGGHGNFKTPNLAHEGEGVRVDFLTVDYISDVSGEITHPYASANTAGLKLTMDAIQNQGVNILGMGALGNSDTEQTFMVRADALDTTSSTTTVAAIQAAIRALNAMTPDKVTATISSATAGDRDMSDTQVA
jgi:hypothetical protein|tara:strand:+ start:855 stop:1274 length:420 start_codon:yes stop_codon:yes gene_type:complete